MAMTAEVLVEGPNKAGGKVVPFRGDLQGADRLAYLAHKTGKWSLPKSYLDSPRRGEVIKGFDGRCLDKVDLKILGERVVSWGYIEDGERHSLQVETFIEGIHPDLGRPHYNGWTSLETVVSRAVFVNYPEKAKVADIEVVDSFPKNHSFPTGYSNSSGRQLDAPTDRRFGASQPAHFTDK
jgi:hypothetical protein